MKFHITSIYILLILFLSISYSDTGYNTIYLMEFENQQNEFTNSHLTEALPDLIKENYKFREDIRVEYAGDLRPYLDQNKSIPENSIKGLIINGRFLTIDDEFFVEFEAYDIHDWKRLVRRQIFCPIHDLICVHDGFLMALEQSISPFLVGALDIEATISSLEKKPKKRTPGYNLDDSVKEDLDKLDNLDSKSENYIYSGNGEQGQYGGRHYREFNFKNIPPDPEITKKQNTEKLISLLDQILINPYEVIIGDLTLSNDSRISGNVNGEIPIEYSVRSNLTQELFNSLPHQKIMDDLGDVILQFPNSNFTFDDLLLEKLSLMKFQLVPVIFFNNRIGGIQFIILDSWNSKYKEFDFQQVSMILENQFRPLFALTPGADQIQIDLDVSTLKILYQFSIPREKLGEYTKVAVKFMKEEELNELLKRQSQGG